MLHFSSYVYYVLKFIFIEIINMGEDIVEISLCNTILLYFTFEVFGLCYCSETEAFNIDRQTDGSNLAR